MRLETMIRKYATEVNVMESGQLRAEFKPEIFLTAKINGDKNEFLKFGRNGPTETIFDIQGKHIFANFWLQNKNNSVIVAIGGEDNNQKIIDIGVDGEEGYFMISNPKSINIIIEINKKEVLIDTLSSYDKLYDVMKSMLK